MVVDGKLQFNIATKISKHYLDKLIALFSENLNKLSICLTEKKDPVFTISDFEDYEPYTILEPESVSNSERLFMFPSGDGGYESYINTLAPHLKNCNTVLFNNFYVYLLENNPEYAKKLTFEKLATLYIAYIKNIQPTGPYHFFGWSFGGVLGIEVMRQLLLRGDKIASVVMLDSIFCMDYFSKITGGKQYEINRLFYKYLPDFSGLPIDTANILLIKANRSIEDEKNLNFNLFEHYSKKTKYNYLDRLINPASINLVHLDSDHLSWIHEQVSLEKVSSVLKDLICQSGKNSSVENNNYQMVEG
jgi:N-(5-amino-5-carboxypentanoyl)-L-cysteinyl-D-valine synthase